MALLRTTNSETPTCVFEFGSQLKVQPMPVHGYPKSVFPSVTIAVWCAIQYWFRKKYVVSQSKCGSNELPAEHLGLLFDAVSPPGHGRKTASRATSKVMTFHRLPGCGFFWGGSPRICCRDKTESDFPLHICRI